jgi:DNA-binding beta-propeller fold protein YncE
MPFTSRISSALAACLLAGLSSAQEEAQPRPPIRRSLAEHTELGEPSGLALEDSGRLWVSELHAGRVVRIDPDGERSVFARGLRGPRDLELEQSPAGPLPWIAESRARRVVRLGADGSLQLSLGAGQLVRPVGLALWGERVLVADEGSHTVEVFTREGEHLASLGSHGSGPGQLIEPRDVAVGEDGRVYVADYGNSRVVVFSSEGEALASWGDWGPFPGLFMGPTGIEVRGGEVYVSDERNHRVQRFDAEGKAIDQFGLHAIRPREGAGKLHYPRALAVSPDAERAAVTEPLVDRVQVFTRTGGVEEDAQRRQVTSLARPSAHFGEGLASSGPYLAIAEPESHLVLIYENSWDEPRRIARVSGLGTKTGLLTSVAGLDLERGDRSLLVCDPALRRLSMFRLRGSEEDEVSYDPFMGRFVKSFDFERGFGTQLVPGQEGVPEPLAVDRDPAGRVYVLDRRNRGVLVLDSGLRPLLERCSAAVFDEPAGLAVDAAGARYAVSDPGAGLVHLLPTEPGAEGALQLGAEAGLVAPSGVAFGAEGLLYVTDAARHEVVVFDASGALVRRWGSAGLGRAEFLEPRGIILDGRGRVVVLDHANHRAQVFTPEGEYVSIFGSRLYTKPARYPETAEEKE